MLRCKHLSVFWVKSQLSWSSWALVLLERWVQYSHLAGERRLIMNWFLVPFHCFGYTPDCAPTRSVVSTAISCPTLRSSYRWFRRLIKPVHVLEYPDGTVFWRGSARNGRIWDISERGLGLQGVLNCHDIPENLSQMISESAIAQMYKIVLRLPMTPEPEFEQVM